MTPILEARGVTAGYAGVDVVRDLDLSVSRGEVVALLGANGAGKSTTLLALAGELRPSYGEVHFDGERARDPLHMRARRGMGFVPEDRPLFSRLSVLANLRLGQGDPTAALEIFPELAPMLSRRAGLLSGGEQQMLVFARILAGGPSVVLADELSFGLAPKAVARLLAAIRKASDAGVGVVLVEQHVSQALAVADRAYVMRRGRIVLEAPAADLARDPERLRRTYLSG